ncbi:MAG: oligopeptidase A [Bradymonadia bacterium]|jgi:oligopeptidase A
MTDNPLLALAAASSATPIPFDRIEASDVEPAIDALLTDCRARLEALRGAPCTWDATAGALDRLTDRLEVTLSVVDHLESVLDDADLRAAYNKARPDISAFYAQLGTDEKIFAVLQRFADSDAGAALDSVRRRYVDETLASFRRSGAALGADAKTRLQALEVELSEACTTFAQNTVDATDAWHLDLPDAVRLAGLPERAVTAARATAEAAGVEGYRITLQYPSYMPIMRYADDTSLRETVWRAYMTRSTLAAHDNRPLVGKILGLRAEKAKLLGYADVADLLLEPRMVRNGARAWDFVEGLTTRTRPAFETEQAQLAEFRRSLVGDDAPAMAAWDQGYFGEKLRQAKFDFDEEALRPYLPADTVIEGLFEVANRLYGVTVTPLSDRPTWHPDVQVYALDDADGQRWGIFYADLYPRTGKRGGAWMRPFMTGDPVNGGDPHVGLICGNFTPPVEGRPALLSHREVQTLFHEFGHLIHHLLTDVPVRSLAGTNVAWDFVELPSQIMENWCWAEPAMALFAKHHETGAPVPAALIARMQAARTFQGATAQMRQLSFATVDLKLHREFDAATDGDPVDHARAIAQQFSTVPLPDDFAMIAGFGHLFASPAGYAAAYYSYKWAEVLDADAFTQFGDERLFDAAQGARFRDLILSKGNSRDPAELYREFMGRDPDPEALMRRAGLV